MTDRAADSARDAARAEPAIVQVGDPVLREAAAPVPPEMLGSAELDALVRTMVDAMRAAPGVGLAAPQIGVALQVIVLEDREEYQRGVSKDELAARERTPLPLWAIVNPTLRSIGSERAMFFEGCLSVRGYIALVERDLDVEVTGLDPRGAPIRFSARGWPARILQHEADHLRGTLYVDRMLTRSLCANEEADRWLDRPVAEVRTALGT